MNACQRLKRGRLRLPVKQGTYFRTIPKNTTIARLRKMMFGATSETSKNVLGDAEGALNSSPDEGSDGDASDDPSADSDSGSSQDENSSETASGHGRPGHGRLGADAYPGAEQVEVTHPQHAAGDVCPDCGQGTLYEKPPGVLVRFTGQAPLHATVYRLQKLRCHLCGKLFTAPVPAGVSDTKYDHTVASMIGLLKYGSGLPFNRLQHSQTACGGCRGVATFLWQPRLSGISCMPRPR